MNNDIIIGLLIIAVIAIVYNELRKDRIRMLKDCKEGFHNTEIKDGKIKCLVCDKEW